MSLFGEINARLTTRSHEHSMPAQRLETLAASSAPQRSLRDRISSAAQKNNLVTSFRKLCSRCCRKKPDQFDSIPPELITTLGKDSRLKNLLQDTCYTLKGLSTPNGYIITHNKQGKDNLLNTGDNTVFNDPTKELHIAALFDHKKAKSLLTRLPELTEERYDFASLYRELITQTLPNHQTPEGNRYQLTFEIIKNLSFGFLVIKTLEHPNQLNQNRSQSPPSDLGNLHARPTAPSLSLSTSEISTPSSSRLSSPSPSTSISPSAPLPTTTASEDTELDSRTSRSTRPPVPERRKRQYRKRPFSALTPDRRTIRRLNSQAAQQAFQAEAQQLINATTNNTTGDSHSQPSHEPLRFVLPEPEPR